MIKLLKYLKPFLLSLLFAIGLLYVQAQAELALPAYLSDIVNVGIQSGGVEHASPEALSADGYDFVLSLANDTNDALIASQYVPVAAGEPLIVAGESVDTFIGTYYRLNADVSDEVRDALDLAFGETVWVLINVGKQLSEAGSGSGFDVTSDFAVTQLYAAVAQMQSIPTWPLLLASAQTSASAVDPMLKLQTGVVLVSKYYAEIGIDMGSVQTNYIIATGLNMLAIALVSAVAMILVALLSSRIGAGFARNLRATVFQKVESFSSQEFNEFSTASLITRTTNDINQIQQLVVMSIRMLFYSPIIAVGGIMMILRTNVSMTWIIVAAVVALFVLIGVIFGLAIPKFKLTQKLIDRLNLVTRQELTGLMVIRAFGNQDYETKKFEGANRDLAKTLLYVNRVIAMMFPAMMFIMNITMVAIIWFGSNQIAASTLQVGDMLAFMNYAMQVIMSFLMIALMFIFFPRAEVSAVRVAEILNKKPQIVDPAEPKKPAGPIRGLVRFEHVAFRFGKANEKVLEDITFEAKPGETTAIIGSTGSGKSTLINLIPRFYDVTEGAITIDGIDIREMTQHDLHEAIGYVPQKGMILSGTVASNLRYGKPDATDAEIREAASVAQATDFIEALPEGYDGPIAQGGANVSGGQKQRLSIARALAKKAPILIFDDSFSALDFKTDQKLRQAMKTAAADTTRIIVAQRVGTIMTADQILVLEKGRIVGRGTHRELLETCPIYYEIASSQLAKEELVNG
ncbi:MAG TPA: ABC transporter ATP-binding protein [Acholeplasmatales bacterium]|nr:MAG: ABC transporter [Tenericutes bacterium GWF2_57_13]HAQ55859.1 ABC transporter ATP-binding protein [Acholeplasmatales bacterium]